MSLRTAGEWERLHRTNKRPGRWAPEPPACPARNREACRCAMRGHQRWEYGANLERGMMPRGRRHIFSQEFSQRGAGAGALLSPSGGNTRIAEEYSGQFAPRQGARPPAGLVT